MASTTKHTPGPWDYWSGYNPYDKIEAQVTAEGGEIVIASYNHLIAEGEANAKLMVAAPDLLKALSDFKREVILSDIPMEHFPRLQPFIDAANAAIAKATA